MYKSGTHHDCELAQRLKFKNIGVATYFSHWRLGATSCSENAQNVRSRSSVCTHHTHYYAKHTMQGAVYLSYHLTVVYLSRPNISLIIAGKVRSIGVSNFEVKLLKELQTIARIQPSVVQNFFTPFFHDKETRKYCKENNIAYIGFR